MSNYELKLIHWQKQLPKQGEDYKWEFYFPPPLQFSSTSTEPGTYHLSVHQSNQSQANPNQEMFSAWMFKWISPEPKKSEEVQPKVQPAIKFPYNSPSPSETNPVNQFLFKVNENSETKPIPSIERPIIKEFKSSSQKPKKVEETNMIPASILPKPSNDSFKQQKTKRSNTQVQKGKQPFKKNEGNASEGNYSDDLFSSGSGASQGEIDLEKNVRNEAEPGTSFFHHIPFVKSRRGLFAYVRTKVSKQKLNNHIRVYASSFTPNYPPENVLDWGESQWISLNEERQWIAFEFLSFKFKMTGYRLKGHAQEHRPMGWVVQGSNDGVNWTDIDSRGDELNVEGGEANFQAKNPLSFSRVRFMQTAKRSGENPSWYFNLKAVELYGEMSGSKPPF